MSTYHVIISRYKDTARARLSAPYFIDADSFDQAHEKTKMIVMGMRDTDPDAEFEIKSIDNHRLHGEECIHGWETQDEFSARVERETSDNHIVQSTAETEKNQQQEEAADVDNWSKV